MNNLKEHFDSIEWPDEFIVEFKDGKKQFFVNSQCINWDNGSDLIGENEGRENITCAWKKKSPSQQKYRMIRFFIDEVKQFKTTSNETIWEVSA